jgi:hypothetical protein
MPLRIVSENSPEDIRRRISAEQVVEPLRRLTANLMRITRGAGNAHELPYQLSALALSLSAYHDAHGAYPAAHELQSILSADDTWRELRPAWMRHETKNKREELTLLREIFAREVQDASLQVVASMLVQQIPQRARGEQDFWQSFYSLRDVHDEVSELWRKEFSTPSRSRRKRHPGDDV